MSSPSKLCKAIRDSFPGAEEIYKNGSCWKFFEIMRCVYPSAHPYYSVSEGHVYTQIDGHFYDIEGLVSDKPDDLRLMSDRDRRKAASWKPFGFHMLRKVIGNCLGVH